MDMLEQKSVTKYHEKLPPQHNLAEEILLGSMLLHSQIIPIAIKDLTTDSFAIETHKLIYGTILKVYFSNNYIDPVILINILWELDLLIKIGGINKVLNLLRQAQIFASGDIVDKTIYYYINLIKDKYIRRLLIQYGYNIIDLAHISSIRYPTIFFKTEKYLSQIKLLIAEERNDNASHLIANLLLNLKIDNEINDIARRRSGFDSLDRLTSGFTAGDLIVIAGRPSMGKTSLSLNIAFNIFTGTENGVSIFSLEMSKEQIIYKLLSIASAISINNIRSGKINNKEWIKLQNAGHQFINSSIEIDDSANLSIAQLGIKARANYNKNPKINLIVIDYLQLLQLEHISLSNRTEELSLITRSLKILAKDLNIPIIVLSQLNRNVENRINKRPLLADLRESGCISKNTYIIIKKCQNIGCVKHIDKNFIYPINSEQDNKLIFQNITYQSAKRIKRSSHQYIYSINSNNSSLIRLTHNHCLLCIYKWERTERIKYFSLLSHTKINDNLLRMALHSLGTIQLMKVYSSKDILMYEEKNFFANDGFVLHNSIEQDADLVLLLYRDGYYNENANNNNLTDIIIAKHRNGPIGTAQLYFQPETSIFKNI